MIEQGIYFALGCIVTALLAMLFAPVFWQRALRLTRQRLQLRVPLSMQEILAERDQLRAEFAVERLRLEQEMARIQGAKDHDMAEIGRRSVDVVKLTDEVATLRRNEQGQQRKIERLERDTSELETTLGALRVTADDAQAAVDLWRTRAETVRGQHEQLLGEVDTHRATIASLNTRSMGLEMRLTDAQRGQETRDRDRDAGLRTKLEAAVAQAARHESAGVALRRELDDAKARIRQLEEEIGGGAPSGATPAAPTDDAGLRESIHALGLAVAKLSRQDGGGARDGRQAAGLDERRTRPVGVA